MPRMDHAKTYSRASRQAFPCVSAWQDKFGAGKNLDNAGDVTFIAELRVKERFCNGDLWDMLGVQVIVELRFSSQTLDWLPPRCKLCHQHRVLCPQSKLCISSWSVITLDLVKLSLLSPTKMDQNVTLSQVGVWGAMMVLQFCGCVGCAKLHGSKDIFCFSWKKSKAIFFIKVFMQNLCCNKSYIKWIVVKVRCQFDAISDMIIDAQSKLT